MSLLLPSLGLPGATHFNSVALHSFEDRTYPLIALVVFQPAAF